MYFTGNTLCLFCRDPWKLKLNPCDDFDVDFAGFIEMYFGDETRKGMDLSCFPIVLNFM
jgi:hypothetical protein